MNNGVEPGATLRDVAALAGVSLGSASHALRPGNQRVSEATRERVLRAVSQLGYEPTARGRRATRVLTVGAIMPDASNSFFSDVLRAAQSALSADGHRLVVASSGDDIDTEEDLVQYLAANIDGLLIAPAGAIGAATRHLAQRKPVVVVDRDGQAPDLPSVRMDNTESANRATRVLISGGYQSVALINGPLRVSTARDRLEGYASALRAAGLPVREEYIRSCEFTFEAGCEAMDDLLRESPPPASVFSSSAILTSGALHALRQQGLRWPDDVAVVGFGDAVWSSLVDPPLTVVEQPKADLGERSVDLLLARVRGSTAVEHLTLASNLVLRESHWPPRARQRRRRRAT